MAQPLRLPPGETANLKLVRVCRVCGGPLGPRNEIGVCQQKPKCKKIAKRLHARRVAAEAKSKQTYRNCLGCGDQLSLRNTTDYCQIKPDCQHQSELQYQRNRRAKMRAERAPAPVKLCKNCGDPVRSDNTTGYCVGKVACRNLYAGVRRQRQAEANGEVREKRFCSEEGCGAVLAYNNSTGVCQSNPECKPHSQRLWQRENSKKKAELRIKTGRQRTCVRCLEPLRKDDITGYCMTNEKCRKTHNMLYQRIRAERRARPTCKVCKKTRLRKDSKYRICELTAKCRQKLRQLKSEANMRAYYRDHEESKRMRRDYYKNKRDDIRDYQNRRKRERHKPVVQETAERINTKEFADVAGISDQAAYYWRPRSHPAIGRPIKTWNTENRKPGSRKSILWSRADANKIAAWETSTSPFERLGGGKWRWGEREFRFTTGMAACVELLYQANQNRSPSLKDEYVLEAAGLSAKRLIDIFRTRQNGKLVPHAAWNTMIVRGDSPGTHQLADPPSAPR
ncbi:MAG: hypothetical protein IIA66_14420 [Planctomycetes bacterium]|nr:hypothetical protein [Planctomycetota bacterium]